MFPILKRDTYLVPVDTTKACVFFSDFSQVRYELIKGHGELFKVQRETGDIELKQNLEGHNREYQLLIAAYDKGILDNSVTTKPKMFAFRDYTV